MAAAAAPSIYLGSVASLDWHGMAIGAGCSPLIAVVRNVGPIGRKKAEECIVCGEVVPKLSACKTQPIGMVDNVMIILDADTQIWPVDRP